MNPHLKTAINLYESHDIDFKQVLDWHLCFGVVVCNNDTFAMGFHTDSADIGSAVLYEHSDTLFVTMCCGDMVRGLSPFKEDYEYISFQRGFKNSHRFRLLNMAKLYSKLK